jgi:hypothetical protein
MINAVNIIAISTVIFCLIWSGRLIYKYKKKYEQVELFWVAWILVIAVIVGNKFI